jgi:hypothetical protein
MDDMVRKPAPPLNLKLIAYGAAHNGIDVYSDVGADRVHAIFVRDAE